MKRTKRQSGFSLTEVMIAAGILAIGFMMVLSIFPAGIHLTAISTERTIGGIAAQEAMAKMHFYPMLDDVNFWESIADPNAAQYNYIQMVELVPLPPDPILVEELDCAYPSLDLSEVNRNPEQEQRYYWTALVRYVDSRNFSTENRQFQATVFVSRLAGLDVQYPDYDSISNTWENKRGLPSPIRIKRDTSGSAAGAYLSEIVIDESTSEFSAFRSKYRVPLHAAVSEDAVLVDDETGRIMPVGAKEGDVLILAEPVLLNEADDYEYFWVLPNSLNGGRYPGVGVYQKILTF